MQTTESVGLNDVQISLLRMFNRKMSHQESVEVRDVLVNYYSQKLFDEAEKVVVEKQITEADYNKLRNEHQRTKI